MPQPTDPYELTLEQAKSRAAADQPLLDPEAQVDHFRIVRLVGRGGMGEVYLARDTLLGRRVALKVVRADAFRDADAVARFLLEARITAQFNHPHIVTVYAVGEHRGSPYVALEFLEGQNLRERIAAQPPAPRESLRIGHAIATALAEAHAHQVLHRDLKPENVILGKDGRLRVVDFGLAKPFGATAAELAAVTAQGPAPASAAAGVAAAAAAAGAPGAARAGEADAAFRTRDGGFVGTPLYMAPEQWLLQGCGSATDVWALGLILWELLMGRHPYADSPIGTLAARVCAPEPVPPLEAGPQLPAAVAAVVTRCLDKDPGRRPSAAEVAEALDAELNRERGRLPGEQSPFRGLLPFTEQHAALFFGRDAEIAEFLERVRGEAVLPVVGPSGSGKSSLVQAGVIPRLREQGRWVVMALRPGRTPFAALSARLVRGETRDSGERPSEAGASVGLPHPPASEPAGRSLSAADATSRRASRSGTGGAALRTPQGEAELTEELARSPGRLALVLNQLAAQENARVLLFVDQLEELYTLVEDEGERRRFLEAVCTAADDPEGPVRVVFTLRDDFLGRMADAEVVRRALSRVIVLRSPGVEALAEVMTRPLHAAGYEYDDAALCDEMVAAVRHEPAALALLQFAGQALWERRDRGRRTLTRAAYAELGGVAGALAHHADAVVDGLPAGQLKLARELLLRLVTPEGTRRVLPRAQALAGLAADAGVVLDRLVQSRLLLLRKARGTGAEEAEVELVHESLVRNWERLARWHDEGREELLFLHEAEQAAGLWDRRGRRDEEVWQGDALHEALRRADRVAGLPLLVQEFLDAGSRLAARQRARRRRRLGAAFGALGFVAASAIAVAVVMSDQKAEVKVQRDRAAAGQREAEAKRAEALRESAQAALAREDLLEARARLRVALEIADTRPARALWARLEEQPLRWRKELTAAVTRVAFSPDGRFVAAAGDDDHLYLIDVRTAKPRLLRGHLGTVYDVAFAPDGRLVTAGGDRRVGVWDTAQAAAVYVTDLPAPVTAVAVSPDGRSLAAGDEAGGVRVFDAATRRLLRTLSAHGGRVHRLAYSPGGDLLAAAGADGVIRLWHAQTGASVRQLALPKGAATGVAFAPDRATLLSTDNGGFLRQWDLATGVQARTVEVGGVLWDVAVGAGGRLLATGGGRASVRLFDLRAGLKPLGQVGGQSGIRGVAFAPDGAFLATGAGHAVRLLEVARMERLETAPGHSRPITDLAFSPDGRDVASASRDGTVRVWDVATGQETRVLASRVGEILDLVYSPDGSDLLAGGYPGGAELLDVGTGQPERALLAAGAGAVGAVGFAPGGRLAATGSFDRTTRVWDVATGAELRVLRGHEAKVVSVGFSPDGRELATASDAGEVRVWDAATGGLRRAFAARTGRGVAAVRFLAGGRLVAAGSDSQRALLWDVAAGRDLLATSPRGRPVTVTPSRDGRRLGVAYADGAVAIWSLEPGAPVDLRGPRGAIGRLRFNADGRLLATGGSDDTVRVWETATGRPLWRAPVLLTAPVELATQKGWRSLERDGAARAPAGRWRAVVEREARAGAASPDGTLLCLLTFDQRLALWDLRADEELYRVAASDTTRVAATDRGCLALTAAGRLTHRDRAGAETVLGERVTAVAAVGAEVVAIGAGEGFLGDAAGTRAVGLPARPGATAVGRVGPWVAVGLTSGRVELLAAAAAGPAPALETAGVPVTAVERIVAGPPGTLVAGYANGFVGVWDLDTGLLLRSLKLHGPAVHLALAGGTLYAASELGDARVVDLTVLGRGYCEVLRAVWAEVPVTWENGAAVVRTPARDHPCAPR